MSATPIDPGARSGPRAGRRELVVVAALALAVLLVYASVYDHEFVEFDDPLYVTENAQVLQGITGSNLLWAFTSRDSYLFHPLTWLSYMVDVELWGVESAGPFALTNVLLHTLNSVLLLLLLRSLTGSLWPSAFAAALFALHPLRVESVAWVSERKDVLAGFFLVLTLWAHANYARRGDARSYALTAGSLLLGLLCKSVLVTLPVLLLLFDVWPLGRVGRVPLWRLVLEKLPLLLLGLAIAGVGISMMGSASNIWGDDLPLGQRVAKAAIDYVLYLGMILWPTDLAVVYPDPVQQGLPFWSAWQVGGALTLLVALSALAVRSARRQPVILVGWLWFLIALLPMIGIVPFGIRAMNDRHTYVPMIGLAFALAFGVSGARTGRPWLRHGWAAHLHLRARVIPPAAVLILISCALLTWRQVDVWRNSSALFDHTLAVTQRNAVVHFSKGVSLAKHDEIEAAMQEFRTALAIHPGHPGAHNSLGWLLHQRGDSAAATRHFRRALELRPGYVQALLNLGNLLGAEGDREASLELLREAVLRGPQVATAHYWLGTALLEAGEGDEALSEFALAVDLDPAHFWSHAQLARLLEKAGRSGRALGHYRAVLAVHPEDRDALRGAAWILATARVDDLRHGEAAVRLAEQLDALTDGRSAPARYTLAAAYAEAGRPEAAVATLREMLSRLTPAEQHWATELQRCLALYDAGRTYRPPPLARG